MDIISCLRLKRVAAVQIFLSICVRSAPEWSVAHQRDLAAVAHRLSGRASDIVAIGRE
jgi:hypothetical protein